MNEDDRDKTTSNGTRPKRDPIHEADPEPDVTPIKERNERHYGRILQELNEMRERDDMQAKQERMVTRIERMRLGHFFVRAVIVWLAVTASLYSYRYILARPPLGEQAYQYIATAIKTGILPTMDQILQQAQQTQKSPTTAPNPNPTTNPNPTPNR